MNMPNLIKPLLLTSCLGLCLNAQADALTNSEKINFGAGLTLMNIDFKNIDLNFNPYMVQAYINIPVIAGLSLEGRAGTSLDEGKEYFNNNRAEMGIDNMLGVFAKYTVTATELSGGQLEPYLMLGVSRFDVTLSLNDQEIPAFEETEVSGVLGVNYLINKNFVSNVEVGSYYNDEDASIIGFSAGIKFNL